MRAPVKRATKRLAGFKQLLDGAPLERWSSSRKMTTSVGHPALIEAVADMEKGAVDRPLICDNLGGQLAAHHLVNGAQRLIEQQNARGW